MGMTFDEARELLASPLWPKVRDHFLATGEFAVYPAGDLRRLEYLDEDTRTRIAAWRDGLGQAAEWRAVVDGEKVRALKAAHPGVYPEVLQYALYFPHGVTEESDVKKLLKLKFPEVYELCCS